MAALALGSGVVPTARVDARIVGGAWQRCDYLRLTGTYDCDGLITAYDATTNLVNDAPPSWGFTTPAILATGHAPNVEIRIALRARLAGTYLAAYSDGEIMFAAGDEPLHRLYGGPVEFADLGERVVEIRSPVPMASWAFTFVRADAVNPARPFLAPPPDEPPAAVRKIR